MLVRLDYGSRHRIKGHRRRALGHGTREGDTMVDTWYDLAVRELSDLTDPAKERLREAEESSGVAPDPDAAEADETITPAT